MTYLRTNAGIRPLRSQKYEVPSGGDTQAPTAPGQVVFGSATSTTLQAAWAASSDNIAVAGYQIRIDGGTPVDVGNVTLYTITGLSPSTNYTVEARAYDEAGNFSAWGVPGIGATLAAPTSLTLDASTAMFTAPDGLTYPDYTYAGMIRWGGKPDTSEWNVVNVNSWSALQSAVSSHNSGSGGTIIEIATGTYPASGSVQITRSNCIIRGIGTVRFEHSGSGANNGGFVIQGSRDFANLTTTSAIRATGARTIEVAGQSYSPGDWIYYSANQPSDVYGHYKSGGALQNTDWIRAVNQVESVAGNTVTLKKPIRVRHPEAIQFDTLRKYSPVQYVGIENIELEFIGNPGGVDGVYHDAAVLCWVEDCNFLRPGRHSFGHGYTFSSNIEYRNTYCTSPWNVGGGGNGYGGGRNASDLLFHNCEFLNHRHAMNTQEHALGVVYHRCTATGSDTQHHTRFVTWSLHDCCRGHDTDGEQASFRFGYLTPGVAEHDSQGDNNVVFHSAFSRNGGANVGMALGVMGLQHGMRLAYSRFHAHCKSWNNYYNVSFGIYVEDFLRDGIIKDCQIYTSDSSEAWAVAFTPGFVPYSENPSNWGFTNQNHPVFIDDKGNGLSSMNPACTAADFNDSQYRANTSELTLDNVTFRGFAKQIAGGLNDPIADPASILQPGSTYTFDDTPYTYNAADFEISNIPVPDWTVNGSLFEAQLAYHGLSL